MKKFVSFPLALPFFILLLLLPLVLLAVIALFGLDAAAISNRALGLSPLKALIIYMAILIGGLMNIPIYEFKSPGGTQPPMVPYMGARYKMPQWLGHRTIVAVNVGGCIIPASLGVYFALHLPLVQLLLTTIIVALGVFYLSRPVRSSGVIVPVLAPPLLAVGASLVALYIGNSGYLDLGRMAFTAGVFGTIIGADVLHLGSIRRIGSEYVSIGGAGTFDGILLTGIIGAIIGAIMTGI